MVENSMVFASVPWDCFDDFFHNIYKPISSISSSSQYQEFYMVQLDGLGGEYGPDGSSTNDYLMLAQRLRI